MRLFLLAVLLVVGAALGASLLVSGRHSPLGRTLVPLFTLFGHEVKTADRMVSRILPVGDMDEEMLGTAFAAKMRGLYGDRHPAHRYLNDLIQHLATRAQKPFTYRVFVVPGAPNAFALPGGVLLVTDGLLAAMRSEAQLVGVLGHEMGHVELGHAFDAARFEMLSRKFGDQTPGAAADLLWGLLARTSFSKAQEAEADDFGYLELVEQGYDPLAMSGAFAQLELAAGRAQAGRLDPWRDYFSSHPPLALREATFRERGQHWLDEHGDERVYVGERNLQGKVTRYQKDYLSEYRP